MATYLFRYVCETALQSEKDASFEYEGHSVVFAFSQQESGKSRCHVSVEVEAADWTEGESRAQSFVQPVLDAVAFATGSPLLLQHWDFILKDENGSTRRALWCEKTGRPVRFQLAESAIEDVRRILSQNRRPALELCWHRYALQRTLILDRFVFQWLAFEGLAGSRQIPTVCPHCGQEVTHCEKSLLHEGSDRQNAYRIFAQVDSSISIQEFTREVWGRARNSVFHGRKYPEPELLRMLNGLSPNLRRACESEFNRVYGLAGTPRPTGALESHNYKYNMFEWQTANAQDRFAGDFPRDFVTKEFANRRDGEVWVADPSTWPIKLLDFEKDSKGW